MDELNDNTVLSISSYLKDKRNFNLKNLRPSLIVRRLNWRMLELNIKSPKEYYDYLIKTDDEVDNLIDSLLINYSTFFRNPFLFEYLKSIILPEVLIKKSNEKNESLRIWSIGCASGEEPYSIAILINEFIQKNEIDFELNFFATDIDTNALNKADKGEYTFETVVNVKYGLLKKYFKKDKEFFYLSGDIKSMVAFSKFNILDKKVISPPQSIFGDFDIVICKNLLIYYNKPTQEIIINKILRSISKNGYLILGKTENLPQDIAPYFKTENKHLHLYKKI